MTFQEYLAEYVVMNRTSSLCKAGEKALEEGLDSPALRILSAMDDSSNFFELKTTATRAWSELGIKLPSLESATRLLIRYYCKAIVNRELDVIEGLRILAQEIANGVKYDRAPDSKPLPDDLLVNFEGMYVEYCDLKFYPGNYDDNLQKLTEKIFATCKEWLHSH